MNFIKQKPPIFQGGLGYLTCFELEQEPEDAIRLLPDYHC